MISTVGFSILNNYNLKFFLVPSKPSPQKNLTGYPRVIRDIVIDVHNNIQAWNKLHLEGCRIVQDIVQKKANNPRSYTRGLETSVNELKDVVTKLDSINQKFTEYAAQVSAVGKLRLNELVFSMDSINIAAMLDSVKDAYQQEYEVCLFAGFVFLLSRENFSQFLLCQNYYYKVLRSDIFIFMDVPKGQRRVTATGKL